jgi:hypothetical protein
VVGGEEQESGFRSQNEERLPSTFRLLLSTFCLLLSTFAFCLPLSTFCLLLSAFCLLLLKRRRSGERDLRYACLLPTAYWW